MLEAEIERTRSRASSGCVSFSASSSTLRLKSSQESSRLKKRLGPKAATPGLGFGCSTFSCKVIFNLLEIRRFITPPALTGFAWGNDSSKYVSSALRDGRRAHAYV